MSAADGTIGECGRANQGTASADLHAGNAVLPALDQAGQGELDGLTAVPRRVKFFTGLEVNTDVVNLDNTPGNSLGAITDDDVLDNQSGGFVHHGGFNNRLVHGYSSEW